MGICYANTKIDTFPLKPLFHIQGYHGNHCLVVVAVVVAMVVVVVCTY